MSLNSLVWYSLSINSDNILSKNYLEKIVSVVHMLVLLSHEVLKVYMVTYKHYIYIYIYIYTSNMNIYGCIHLYMI